MIKSFVMLQKEADQQLELELETQQTLEHFMGQMISLKNAFAMLSDVVMHEVDAARSEARRRIDASDTMVHNSEQRMELLLNQNQLLSSRLENVERKQDLVVTELQQIKTQGDQTQNWLTSVSEQTNSLKEQFQDVSTAQITTNSETAKECSELKRHFDNQSHTIVGKINDCSAEISKQRSELAVSSEQRMDDLELLEKALSTLQAQQVRLRSGVDESVVPLQTEIRGLKSKVDQIDASISTVKMDGIEARSEIEAIDRDSRHRFENVSRVMKQFATSLQVGVPPSVNNGFQGLSGGSGSEL